MATGQVNGSNRLPADPIPQGTQSAATLAQNIRREEPWIDSLVEKMRSDYQVKLAELVLQANMRKAQITIVAKKGPAGVAEPRAEALAERLTDLWEKTFKSMADCIAYGRVAYEKVWAWDNAVFGRYVRKLQPLPFRLTKMRLVDANAEEDPGAFDGIDLLGGVNSPEEIPTRKSWWLALDPQPLQPHGRSRFMGAAHRTWAYRDEALERRKLFIKKLVINGGIARGPDEVPDGNGGHIKGSDVMQAAKDALDAGDTMYLPNTRDPEAPNDLTWQFDPSQIDVRDASPMTSLIDQMDGEQLVAFGIPPKTVIEGDGVGSFALVTQQMLILLSVVEDILDQWVESFQAYVVDASIAENWPDGQRPVIEINYSPLTDRPDDLAVDMVKQWLTTPALSPFLLSGAVDVEAVFESVGIPLSDNARELIAAHLHAAGADQQQPPQATPAPGNPPVSTHSQSHPADPSSQPHAAADPKAVPQALAVDPSQTLNGAQITAAIEIIKDFRDGAIGQYVARQLLEAVGIGPHQAAAMIGESARLPQQPPTANMAEGPPVLPFPQPMR